MKRSILLALLFVLVLGIDAQDILTADQFFAQVSERYGQVKDYEAKIGIAAGKSLMSGALIYKAPSLLRIDFSQPPDQVIAFDGENLEVYLPEYNAVLSQTAASNPRGSGAGLATADGLKMMRRNYTVRYESNPTPLPLEEGSSEAVVRLVLSRRTVSEGFKTIVLSINAESKLIRRIEGTSLANERYVFDFTGIKLNQNIPEARFIYDSPASANVYNNFLFGSDGN